MRGSLQWEGEVRKFSSMDSKKSAGDSNFHIPYYMKLKVDFDF